MLAERVVEWTEQWKQEGLEQGREEGLRQVLEKVRGVLLLELERRFGPLPADLRRQIDEIGSIEELTELSLRVGGASSISELGLGVP